MAPTKLLTLVIEDAGGDKSPVSVHIGDSGTGGIEDEESFLEVYLQPWWDAIRPLVNGVLIDAYVRLSYDISNFTNNTPSAISDIEEKAVFVFGVSFNTRPVRLSLPTIKESFFIGSGSGKELDITDSDVVYFVHLMTNDLDENGIDPRDSHGNVLNRLLLTEQFFGKG